MILANYESALAAYGDGAECRNAEISGLSVVLLLLWYCCALCIAFSYHHLAIAIAIAKD